MRAGARNFDGAIDADLPEHERRITQLGAARPAEVRNGATRVIDLLITGGHVVTPFEEGELDVGHHGRDDRLRRAAGQRSRPRRAA